MTRAKIQAVIFDCDGTLVDSEVLGCKAMHEVAQGYGCTLPFDDFVHTFTGRTMTLNIETLNQHSASPMPENFATEVRAAMAKKFEIELTEIAGAKELLTTLQSRGIPVALATNGPRFKAEQTLGLTGLLPFFQNKSTGYDTLFSAYDHETFKPDPKLFELAAAKLGMACEACAAIEDSWSGLAAGLAAGMPTFSLTKLSTLAKPLPNPLNAPLIELAKLSDLLAHL